MTTAILTLDQARAKEEADRKEWEARETFQGFTVADLRKTMDAVQSPDGWKRPWVAAVHHDLVRIVQVAVEFFHADTARINGIEPLTGRVLMSGNGYQA